MQPKLWMALTLILSIASAQATPPPGQHAAYNINAPVYPVTYSEAQKSTQREAARSMIKQLNAATATGARSFTVPPGVYRVPATGPDNEIKLSNVKNFTLYLANTEFVLETGGSFIFPRHCENLTCIGPAKIDADTLTYTQGTLRTYDSQTGLATVEIMPGYEVSDSAKGTVDAFSTTGVYLANPSWAGYRDAKVIDQAKRLVQVTLGAKDAIFTDIYKPGVLLVLRLHGSPVLLAAEDDTGFTLQDIDDYRGCGIGWGGGQGNWNFIRVRGIPRPGTNRLSGSGGCQMGNFGGDVLFDSCEFSVTADDLMDYYGGGLFMASRQESPREVITWGGTLNVGATLNFYSHTDFHPIGSARITAITELKDPTFQITARDLIKNILKARDVGDRTMRRLILDQDIQLAPGDFVENGSANRPDHFTIRNCYFHDSGVRVMVQGFKHGLFENNRFERISGGLALTCDAWWWEGPTCQDITVRNNVFQDTTFRNAWGTGKAAITVATGGSAPADPGQGVAIQHVNISGNTIIDSSNAAISISNAADVMVQDNTILHPFTLGLPAGAIQLTAVRNAQVSRNTLTGCPGANLVAKNVYQSSINDNSFKDSYQKPGSAATPTATITLDSCKDMTVQGNTVTGTDAAHIIWIENSTNTQLKDNHAKQLTTPGAMLVGTRAANVELHG